MSLLSVTDLHVGYRQAAGLLPALRGVSFALDSGESLGLVGESGCGKTTLARALLRLLPGNGVVSGGQVTFRDRALLDLPIDEFRKIRWREIAVVTQSAMNALDPVVRVGHQIVEAIRKHERCTQAAAFERAGSLFAAVGLEAAWLSRYPHEFRGGMRQRAIIAMALALDPVLIIADEPTTALDVVMQDQVYEHIARIRRDRRRALILITHDLALVGENCDRIAVMYAGRIVETAASEAILNAPLHPYTIGLRNAFPDFDGDARELISIPGAPPGPGEAATGCAFAPRCPFAAERCRSEAPVARAIEPGHEVACHFAEDAPRLRMLGALEATWERGAAGLAAAPA